jgi:putative tricarboxylic transport membrane protein
MVRREWTINLVMLLIGAVFIIESMRLGLGRIQRPGPGMLPLITGSGLSLVALYSLVLSLLVPKGKEARFFGPSIGNVLVILVGLVAYVLLLPWLGYLTGTFMLLTLLFRAGGFRKWGTIVASALLTSAVTYLVFSTWLNLRFPKGVLGF